MGTNTDIQTGYILLKEADRRIHDRKDAVKLARQYVRGRD